MCIRDRLKHSAITCVARIVEKYGKKDTSAVLSAVNVIASDAALGYAEIGLQVISLQCLSSTVEVLRDEMVTILPRIMETAVGYLEDAVGDEAQPRLHDAALTLLNAVLEHLPWAYSAKLLGRVLKLCCTAAADPDLGKASAQIREQFSTLSAEQLDMKVLLPAIEATSDDVVEDGYFGCNELLSTLQKVVTSQPKATLLRNASALLSALQKTFDLRRLLALAEEDTTSREWTALDKKRDAIMLDSIMKLNDATFRPFFVRLVEWATEALPANDQQGRLQRSISLYGFLTSFFERLKSIVTSYATYTLDNSAAILRSAVLTEETQQSLLKNVLLALSSSFRHDQDDFWQAPSHFGTISAGLLSLLERAKAPADRDALGVIAAITELAAATSGSQEQHKELNGALLKSMRSDDAQIRLAAVKCEQSLTDRLGEDWLGLLPEMLPFISELQEDDDEVVERETLGWIKQIEGILGESLEGMLQ